MRSTVTPTLVHTALVALGLSLSVIGCGRVGQDQKPSGTRPPVTAQASAAITDRDVGVSPGRLGAGPVRIVITNQSGSSTALVLRKSSGGSVARTRTTVAPGTAATIQADLSPGRWTLSASRGRTTVLRVGPRRGSGDDALLLP